MNEQSAFIINEESHEKIVKENEEEKRKELKRKKTNARQRAYYQRQKDLKKNEEIIKTVPKSNAERQRKFRQHNAEKSSMDMKFDLIIIFIMIHKSPQQNMGPPLTRYFLGI
ncbi:uncharacterized protein LOC128667991 [Microplitis demolitor]|uniref:uncharacterized protein LOC128667991 n=1 Tax=Microplitis demolitor TaxID=69319 RepID=UPI00235B5C20|nr:uncharacterized protein LOC128667991 [Microplitis demolitor]